MVRQAHKNAKRRRLSAGFTALPIVAPLGAMLLVVGFQSTLSWTNTEEFCLSCHEMRAIAYEEFKDTSHDRNAHGVRATCADCHVPKEFGPKLLKKVIATKDLYHHLLGSIDTPEKYDSRRLEMAERVWQYMQQTDSRECRVCHDHASMSLDEQTPRAARKHEAMEQNGETCIDCHQGVAHTLPDGFEES